MAARTATQVLERSKAGVPSRPRESGDSRPSSYMSILTPPGMPGNPFYDQAKRLGIKARWYILDGRPATHFGFRGLTGHLLPDFVRSLTLLAEAAKELRRERPVLATLVPREVIELMAHLAAPGSHLDAAVSEFPLTDEVAADLIFVPDPSVAGQPIAVVDILGGPDD